MQMYTENLTGRAHLQGANEVHVAIIGPSNPSEFFDDLDDVERFPLGMGGIPVNGLVRSLLDLGHRVSLFTAARGESETWRASGSHLSIVAVPYRDRARTRAFDFFGAERAALSIELVECDADVFHAHWTYEFALACIDAGVQPLVVTAHDAPLTILKHLPDGYRLIRAVMAFRARLSIKNLTAVAPYLAGRWRTEMLFKRDIAVIPNALPPLQLSSGAKAENPVILEVADASPLKNVKTLIRAFSLVKSAVPGSELRLVGPGLGTGDSLEGWAIANNLSSGVHFLGRLNRDDIALQYSQATLFSHSSLEEAQPMCLLEAMSASLPIVAGIESGGVPWTLFGGRAGVLVDVASSHELAVAIISTIQDPGGSARRSAVALGLLTSRHAPGVIAAQYIQQYEMAMRQFNKKLPR